MPALSSVTSFNERLLHWHETLDAFLVEELFGDEFAAIGGIHRKPDGGVLFFHSARLLMLIGIAAVWAYSWLLDSAVVF